MNDLIRVDYSSNEPTVSARELHEFLEVGAHFRDWFPRMCEYGFTQGRDFNPLKIERVQIEGSRETKRSVIDYQLTIPMAKEICMIQRTEKGKIARQYFLSIEKAWNTPEMVMFRALKMADSRISDLQLHNFRLMSENSNMLPKAAYFDDLVDKNLLTNFRDAAKELKIGERRFINMLLDEGYLYRDSKGRLKPYADRNKGLFEIKETISKNGSWVGTQTLITPKGRDTFRLLIKIRR